MELCCPGCPRLSFRAGVYASGFGMIVGLGADVWSSLLDGYFIPQFLWTSLILRKIWWLCVAWQEILLES